ncbi:MAG: DUF4124 domain-containing protein [Burkholderiales bacterium]|nr:DUF4124 domain-containing protein [Burkholderiales bacterium]
MMHAFRFLLACAACASFALPAQAAMYKWTDENGSTHYGDSVPPKFAHRASDRFGKPVVAPAKTAALAPAAPSEQDAEKQKAIAKAQLDRQRQDTALLATYANEGEIELARNRELRRNQDTLSLSSAGLAKSSAADDRRKLDALMSQSREQTDLINAKYDAQKIRFRELTGPKSAQAQPAATK